MSSSTFSAAAPRSGHYETLFSSKDSTGISWCVERMPTPVTDPMVVSFRKWNGRRSLLNQYARWTGDGWDSHPWTPKSPTVPQAVLKAVESRLLKAAP